MAKLKLNPALGGLSGKIDGWIYRQRNGETVVHAHRETSATVPTPAQLEHRRRFGNAQLYAAEIMSDPLKREVYTKLAAVLKRPVNTLLVSNFLTPPTIDRIDCSEYDGRQGQRIRIIACDAIEVTDVEVRIRLSDSTLVESGLAVHDHGVWDYLTVATVPPGRRWQVEILARNRARAEGMKTFSG